MLNMLTTNYPLFEDGLDSYTYDLQLQPMQFSLYLKQLSNKGNLVYEYNPFRNYRLTKEETIIENGQPVIYKSGSLVDFDTDASDLGFDLNHPVMITPQYSYDGSVNLILNDGNNIPRLINSRFTSVGKNRYEIIDRAGSNDTNIYNQGDQFDIDTSLYKRIIKIPNVEFYGVLDGGNLKIGNYTFYFKYADADGNETDFVAESGMVAVFIGNSKQTIRSGSRDEISYKSVQFNLSNIDSAYNYVTVYYTRSTSSYGEPAVTTAHKLDRTYIVNNAGNCNIIINGFETVIDLALSDINIQYNIAKAVEAQTACQNMLFLGNVHKPDIPYSELSDLALRFCPKEHATVNPEGWDYRDPITIYKYTGYWDEEIYRTGIVFILPDNSLSPVFNTRGITSTSLEPTDFLLYKGEERVYISVNESDYSLTGETSEGAVTSSIENAKGVFQINSNHIANNDYTIFGIDFVVTQEVLSEIAKYAKGFFFVRQKRIPLVLCQALTVGLDREAKIPVIPVGQGSNNEIKFIAERFFNDDRVLTQSFDDRLYYLSPNQVDMRAAICPEYDLNAPYLNQLFTGGEFKIRESSFSPSNKYFTRSYRNLYVPTYKSREIENSYVTTKIIGVGDNVPLVATSDYQYRGRVGEAEEAWRFRYLNRENKIAEANNLVRGSFGPYIGIEGYNDYMTIIDIMVPGYEYGYETKYFSIRYEDNSPFYAISNRFDINDLSTVNGRLSNGAEVITLYRGDCYICEFTHRVNRNFQDPDAPTNDVIVDENTWKDNYSHEDTEKNKEINRGDVNAVEMGMWVTFKVKSNFNLNLRDLDASYPTEEGLTGHKRGFYPLLDMSADGSSKIPESLTYNNGFKNTLGERFNFETPDVPYIKNEFGTRIMYSDIYVNDAFKNGFRVFQLTHYRDYPRMYGSIIKMVELFGNILCIFEHGIALIPVNERAVAGEGSGGNVFINTSNVLPENPKMLSDTYGTQWPESVVQTPYFVYGVDTVGKKIWRTNGDQFEIISDFKIQEFLNENITLSERELTPVIGVRNVKSHYNAFKQDVMFTFYDNLYGFEEKAWNICYNEVMQKFVTFYSWIPSYSANIDNMYFSFDRNTSKWISKLGTSNSNSVIADGISLSDNVIKEGSTLVGALSLSNRNLPIETEQVTISVSFELQHDNFDNYKLFDIKDGNLLFTGDYNSIKANMFLMSNGEIAKDELGRRIRIPQTDSAYNDKLVLLLNIKCKIGLEYEGAADNEIKQYVAGWKNTTFVDAGYYESTVAVIPEYNLQFLSTDFWKHGQSGIIDIQDSIHPCYWYGKQHPFEYEFVVVDNPATHKIFENLQIVSNKAVPDSFHYEVVGESYEFHEDKKNMYIRQEATKDFYQYNGSDILYNRNFLDLRGKQRDILRNWKPTGQKVKSTMFPLYYARVDTFNEIEDYYKGKTAPNKDYVNLSGSEIVYNEKLDEFRVWTHAKAADIKDPRIGRLRGNMNYQGDVWNIQINPIIFVQRNEPAWNTAKLTKETIDKVPISVGNSPIPNDLKGFDITSETPVEDYMPQDLIDLGYGPEDIDTSDWWSGRKEARLRDKYIKIRVRYTGEELAIITALKTLYTISYA